MTICKNRGKTEVDFYIHWTIFAELAVILKTPCFSFQSHLEDSSLHFYLKKIARGNPYLIKLNRPVKTECRNLFKGTISHGQWGTQQSLPLWWFALETAFPHKVTRKMIISSFPFVAFCKYLLLILQDKSDTVPKNITSSHFRNCTVFKSFMIPWHNYPQGDEFLTLKVPFI